MLTVGAPADAGDWVVDVVIPTALGRLRYVPAAGDLRKVAECDLEQGVRLAASVALALRVDDRSHGELGLVVEESSLRGGALRAAVLNRFPSARIVAVRDVEVVA